MLQRGRRKTRFFSVFCLSLTFRKRFAFVQICNGNPVNVPSRHTGNLYCSETIVSGDRCGLLHSSALKSSETLPVAHLGGKKKKRKNTPRQFADKHFL